MRSRNRWCNKIIRETCVMKNGKCILEVPIYLYTYVELTKNTFMRTRYDYSRAFGGCGKSEMIIELNDRR